MNLLKKFEESQLQARKADYSAPEFAPGDTVRVSVKEIERARERIQAFEGVCIAFKSAGINSSFTVRKNSYGEAIRY